MEENAFIKGLRISTCLLFCLILLLVLIAVFLFWNECFNRQIWPFYSGDKNAEYSISLEHSHLKLLSPVLVNIIPEKSLRISKSIKFKHLKIYSEVTTCVAVFLLLILFFISQKNVSYTLDTCILISC